MYVCPSCGLPAQAPGFCTEDGAALASTAGDPLLGQTVGSYRIARLIGQGGMGAVYLGVQPSIGSRVAIKVLSPSASSTAGMVDRFFAEARAANKIRHESIVNVLDLSVLPDQRPYIVMEYLEGAPLASHFEALRPFPLGLLARIGLETLGALDAAHSHGITHRDLKPDNLFLTSLGRVKVLDFGIAKLRPELGGQSDATRTGALLGTPQYMSPEQALGQPVDTRADIYSLGVVLFEGATGRRPFEADSLFELLKQHIEATPPHPSSLRPDLPPAFEHVIWRAMEKDKNRRFQSAAEMAQALSAVLATLPDVGMSAPPLPPPRPSAPTPMVLAPTAAQSHATVGGVGMSAPVPARSSPIGFIVGVLGALVALVAVVAVVAIYFVLDRETVNVTFEQGGGPPSGAEAVAGLADARSQARKHFADAELVTISVSGVKPDGSVKLEDNTHAVSFMFRSPSASKTSKKCMVSVSTSMYGTFTSPYEDASFNCAQPVINAPKCSLAQVMKKAPAGTKTAVFNSQAGGWSWVLMGGSGAVTIIPDNC
ncbi:MAG: serine/threonine protein kinase [Myxococcales bacterium]|nr:serine/threonine protein kinase [Myxococcales bacterium]